jgi:flagellar hook-basal body complex protein FliE
MKVKTKTPYLKVIARQIYFNRKIVAELKAVKKEQYQYRAVYEAFSLGADDFRGVAVQIEKAQRKVDELIKLYEIELLKGVSL